MVLSLTRLLSSGKMMVGWSNPNKQDALQGFAFFSNVNKAFPKADMKFVFISVDSKLADSSLFIVKVPP
jgi:hypothetical protein